MKFKIEPQPYRPGASFLTLLEKEILRFKKIALQTIFAPVLMGLLYLLVFGQVLAGKMPTFDGVNYLHFLVPGLDDAAERFRKQLFFDVVFENHGKSDFYPAAALCRLGAVISDDRRLHCTCLNRRRRCFACFVPLVSSSDGPYSLDFGLWVYGRRSYGVPRPYLRIMG